MSDWPDELSNKDAEYLIRNADEYLKQNHQVSNKKKEIAEKTGWMEKYRNIKAIRQIVFGILLVILAYCGGSIAMYLTGKYLCILFGLQ